MDESMNMGQDTLKILEHLPYPFYVIDAQDYTILQSNKGLPRSGKDIPTCYAVSHGNDHPCDAYGEVCPLQLVKDGKESVVVEHKHYNEQGEPKYYEVHCHPIFDQHRNVKQVIEYSLDITRRKETEEDLLRNERLLNDTQKLTRIGGWEWDVKKGTMFWTDEVYRIHGWEPGEIEPGSEEHIRKSSACYEPEARPIVLEAFQQCIEEGVPYELELPFTTVKGESRWVRTAAYPVFAQGSVVKVIGNLMDITSRKEMERALRENEQRLQQEIEKAKLVHEKTIPKSIPELEGIEVYAYYQPAAEMGGDFYSIIQIDEKLLFYISDITGHGLDAALMSGFVENTMSCYINHLPKEIVLNPGELLTLLAKQYAQKDYPEHYFITILLGVIDPQKNTLTYSSAGIHVPPLLVKSDGDLVELTTGNLPISAMIPKEHQIYHNVDVELSCGTTLFFSTDGLTEQESKGDVYEDRHYSILQKQHDLPPPAIAECINKDFKEFTGSISGDDDITYIILQMKEEYPNRV